VGCPHLDDWVYVRWYPCHAGFAKLARRGLREFAARCGFERPALDDIESAAGEALANAVEHGHNAEKGIVVKARSIASGMLIEIHDNGPGFTGDLRTRNGRRLMPRGYGIRLMTTLMDAVEFTDNGRCVRLTKYLEPPRL
jgi:anti-sigma regulatory factor (Ser/Thr protein kinase)